MKKHLILPLFFIVTLASCQNEDPCDQYQIDTPVEIDFSKTISFCDESMSISFTKVISDSRCPENVVCIWQGLAEVEVLISVSGREEKFLLSTYPPFNNIPSEVVFGDYRFSLENVSPYPNTSKSYQEKDYSIEMLVEKTSE